ncbi:MAG: hypothetical protein IT270_12420 [Saprospiraceae bacterium]|nr:hypothetical protein [Saprospiraceae bacterium]
MQNTPPEHRSVHDLEGHSWNLELIISGAAIVLATYLPEAVEDYFYYYLQYMSFDYTGSMYTLPIMAYSFFKVVAWLLIVAFVAHLVMRAFWVSLVGLKEVFPHGIRYDNIPNVSEDVSKYQEEKLGSLDVYMVRLDRLCNQIFAFAFLLAMSGVGVGIAYHLIFGVYQLMDGFLSEAASDLFFRMVFFVFIGMAVFMVVASALMKNRPHWSKKYGTTVARLTHYFGKAAMPLVYKPLNILMLAFVTNIPRKRYYMVFSIIMVGFMGSVLLVFTDKVSDLRGRHLLEPRHFFSSGALEFEVSPDRYDNQRSSPRRVPSVSLPADVIEGPFLPVFVLYPRMLDTRLFALGCPEYETDKNKPRDRRLFLRDSQNMACLNRFFQLRINDSIVAQPDWMFHQKPGSITKGLIAYLPTQGLRPGKNTVSVHIPSSGKPDSLERYGAVPFWLAPKD